MGGIGSGESQRLAAQGVIGDDDVCHANRSGSVGIFVERADEVGERNAWRFVDIGNVEGVGDGIVGRCSHGDVIHVDVDVVAILGLEVERGAGSQSQLVADDLEVGGIDSGESQRLAAQGVIGDDDVCHANRSGSVGIFVERADEVGERNAWRFVDIGNVEGVCGGIVGRCSHGVVIHVDVDVVAILGLEVERGAGSQP